MIGAGHRDCRGIWMNTYGNPVAQAERCAPPLDGSNSHFDLWHRQKEAVTASECSRRLGSDRL